MPSPPDPHVRAHRSATKSSVREYLTLLGAALGSVLAGFALAFFVVWLQAVVV